MKNSESRFSTLVDSAFAGIGLALLFVGTIVAPSSLAYGDWGPIPESCIYSCASCVLTPMPGGWEDCVGTCDTTSGECDDCLNDCHRQGSAGSYLCLRCEFAS